MQIHCRLLGREDVTAGSPDDAHLLGGGSQCLAETGKVAVQRPLNASRRTLSPHPVHELVHRHHVIGIDQQCDEYALLPGMSQVYLCAVDTYFDTAQ
ncbi:hypothetical protein SSPO_020860 [Streptomyces antimycoticus]|uniref:Uncharacterized protein n=1 Tax=Streptomyces antimycoticus TaxID=68175 RepID=A0A499UII9_9ACTN|nr:hypothetical protein SSPO_020860 [Streptomyces antimycoticus]